MSIIESIILGIVQGITEFLPISSTGHLVLTRSLFSIDDTYALAFDAVLHLATALAVIVYFHKDIMVLINTALRKLGRLPVNPRDMTLLTALAVGTIPAVILGLLLESHLEEWFRNPVMIAGVLVLGSILFMVAEWIYLNSHQNNEINLSKGMKIGLFQAMAIIPGLSRSGATISGGMILGLTRVEAARFAFLLAIPIILGAGAMKLLELLTTEQTVEWTAVIIGAAVSFVVGLAAIHFMLSFVRNNTLWPFIWYRIILAAFIIFVVYFG